MIWYDHHFGKLPEHAKDTKDDTHHSISQQACLQSNASLIQKDVCFFLFSTFAQQPVSNKGLFVHRFVNQDISSGAKAAKRCEAKWGNGTRRVGCGAWCVFEGRGMSLLSLWGPRSDSLRSNQLRSLLVFLR